MKKYQLLDKFIGYQSKPDPTNSTDPRILVAGSQNVLITEQDRIATRKGYTLKGAASSNQNPVESSYDWVTSSNSVLNIRAYSDELVIYLGTVDGVAVNAWTRIKDSWSDVDFVFDTVWNSTELIDILVFVNGGSNLYDWSGAVTTLASATSNTLTKNGTDTWGEARFLTSGTRKVVINGTEYTYTGGEDTTILTGVTPDPSGEAADSVVVQAVRTNSNKPASGFNNDFIRVQNNQLWVGSNTSNRVYVSKDTDFTDFSFSSPRVAGEGALLTLDGIGRGFARFQDKMAVFAGRDLIYVSQFNEIDVAGTLAETLKVKKLKTSKNQAAQSQDLIAEIGDSVAFLTFEPALRILGDIENIQSPQTRSFSNPIKPDFDAETWTNGHMLFDSTRLYITAPTNGRVYILEFSEDADGNLRRFWQPPQIMPIRRMALIDNAIHGHSSQVEESYKLFDGTNDNDLSFKCIAALAYNSFGDRVNLKAFDEYYVEGYISGNTKLDVEFKYEFGGGSVSKDKTIDGSDEGIQFGPDYLISLGQSALGTQPQGGSQDDTSDNPKFKTILSVPKTTFSEFQIVFSTDTKDYEWSLLALGPQAQLSTANNIAIKR